MSFCAGVWGPHHPGGHTESRRKPCHTVLSSSRLPSLTGLGQLAFLAACGLLYASQGRFQPCARLHSHTCPGGLLPQSCVLVPFLFSPPSDIHMSPHPTPASPSVPRFLSCPGSPECPIGMHLPTSSPSSWLAAPAESIVCIVAGDVFGSASCACSRHADT